LEHTWNTQQENILRKFCIFIALLHSHNRSIAVKLFDILNTWEHISLQKNETEKGSNINIEEDVYAEKLSFYNEMRLLFSMASLHPALDFTQRATLRRKKENFTSSCQKPTEPLHELLVNGDIDNSDTYSSSNQVSHIKRKKVSIYIKNLCHGHVTVTVNASKYFLNETFIGIINSIFCIAINLAVRDVCLIRRMRSLNSN